MVLVNKVGRGKREDMARRLVHMDQLFSEMPRKLVDVAQLVKISRDTVREDITILQILGSNIREVQMGYWYSSHPALSVTENKEVGS